MVDGGHAERHQQRQQSLAASSSDQTGMPPAVMTISSLSPLRRLSTWMQAISSAIGAISASMLGIASVVMARKRRASWPCVVISSSWRSATRDPHDAGQGKQDEHERTGRLPKIYRLRMRPKMVLLPRGSCPPEERPRSLIRAAK